MSDPVEGAKCAFTYYFMHPHDSSIQKSIEYFRSALQMWPNNFTLYREPGVSPQQTHYQMASNAYHNKEWLKAIDNFEVCFKLYTTDLQQCRAYCEDVLYINITGVEFGLISGGTTLKVDTMDTYSLMSKAIETVVQCRSECYRKVSTINGVREKGYLASIFNFLQFAYYSGEYRACDDMCVCVCVHTYVLTMHTCAHMYTYTHNVRTYGYTHAGRHTHTHTHTHARTHTHTHTHTRNYICMYSCMCI